MIGAIVLSIICVIILIVIGSLLYGFITVPYVPTPQHILKEIEKLNLIHDNQTIVELGSGDASFLRYFARRNVIKAYGYEISPPLVLLSTILAKLPKYKGSIHIQWKSYYDADIVNADIIYTYLLPKALRSLIPLFSQMKEGAQIISYDFRIPGYEPQQTIQIGKTKKLYIYIPSAWHSET
jgi:hypothetical protein